MEDKFGLRSPFVFATRIAFEIIRALEAWAPSDKAVPLITGSLFQGNFDAR
jgi:hypothetical protein